MWLPKPIMRFISWVLSRFMFTFHFFLCCSKEGGVVENIESDISILRIVTTMQKDYIWREWIFWSVITTPCSFTEKKVIRFSEVALVFIYCNFLIGHLWSRKDIGLEMLPLLRQIFACLSKMATKTLKQFNVC